MEEMFPEMHNRYLPNQPINKLIAQLTKFDQINLTQEATRKEGTIGQSNSTTFVRQKNRNQ
ncbi:hypothetical protein DAPPUDRAFT_267758 [Daphnia pulex]|uniref:Uncharacterized protein n=1 Tax=Daphnia pulex TaxID=6669 RepID=E9HWX4_DAPPU|nr:hypothetical protein DAPPUDRAFT_267758 [Daphnia pulex]|eukprot:EFX63758.1 hypothetical protein DAPPUDRAFT_267758 [Daphnia pulex]